MLVYNNYCVSLHPINNKTTTMRKILFILLGLYTIVLIVTFTTLLTKHQQKEAIANELAQTEARLDSAIVTSVRSHSMLYTAEAKSQKTMTYSSSNKVSFKFMGIDKDMDLPFSKTEATIPVSVTYKAGINLMTFNSDNIYIAQRPQDGRGGSVVITLPDPVIVETAVQVDHENEKMKKEFLGKGLTYEQYQKLIRQAKEEAWQDLSEEDIRAITETAKVSATELIIPQLKLLGFDNIEVTYRQELNYTTIERTKN